ncbi:MAG: hypothetical protein EOM72_06265 [Opitutae bacterium]|nr:hypothetical protein [Opitutae bacterium]
MEEGLPGHDDARLAGGGRWRFAVGKAQAAGAEAEGTVFDPPAFQKGFSFLAFEYLANEKGWQDAALPFRSQGSGGFPPPLEVHETGMRPRARANGANGANQSETAGIARKGGGVVYAPSGSALAGNHEMRNGEEKA